MLCCPPLSVLFVSGLLPWPIHRLKDEKSMMYEVFLGDLLPGELGNLLHRADKYFPLSQNNVPLCKNMALENRRKEKRKRGEQDRERERKQEMLLGLG